MKTWMYILVMLAAACTPTVGLNGWYPSDASLEATVVGNAIDVSDAGVVPTMDVQTTTDVVALDRVAPTTDVVAVIDRPVIVDTPAPIDRPVPMPDIVRPRDAGPDVTGPRGITPGTRVRGTTNSAVYYYARDGQRYLFLNDAIHASWYRSFDGVVTLSDPELSQIPEATTFIPSRAGTWLIKEPGVRPVYAIEFCGVRRRIAAGDMSEAVALALFGPNWNTGTRANQPGPGVLRTRDLDPVQWSSYRDGAPITNYTHPNGSLIRYAGRSERYLVMDGRRRLITPDAFIANRFYESFVTTTTLVYPDGTPITGYEPEFSEPVCLR